jgi:hypothetical protein
MIRSVNGTALVSGVWTLFTNGIHRRQMSASSSQRASECAQMTSCGESGHDADLLI